MPSTSELPVPTVWIVDDDPDDQFLFEVTFKNVKPTVYVEPFLSGELFLQTLKQCDSLPSLVLLDLNMPVMDGFAVLKELRADPRYKHLPVVILSTSRREEDRIKSYELGASGVLTKVGSTGQLLMLFNQLVQGWNRPA